MDSALLVNLEPIEAVCVGLPAKWHFCSAKNVRLIGASVAIGWRTARDH